MGKVGSEIALRQVPARPYFAAGSYLHANLAWHLGTVYRVPGKCVFEARSLIALHPLGTKHQASCSLIHPRSLVSSAQSGSFSASSHSNAVLGSSGEGAPETLSVVWFLANVCVSYVGLREHPRLS